MLKLRRVDIERSEEVFKRIEEYKKKVIEKLDPMALILFGSFAKEDINEGSDVDFTVIADFKEGFLDRIKTLMELNDDSGLPLEPVGYTPAEFRKMKEEGNPFILEVLRSGKVLYGKVP